SNTLEVVIHYHQILLQIYFLSPPLIILGRMNNFIPTQYLTLRAWTNWISYALNIFFISMHAVLICLRVWAYYSLTRYVSFIFEVRVHGEELSDVIKNILFVSLIGLIYLIGVCTGRFLTFMIRGITEAESCRRCREAEERWRARRELAAVELLRH
ncbi:hypothetical protein PFISCL1PPCAC_24542, partial [Pristionchus fissidentatus]